MEEENGSENELSISKLLEEDDEVGQEAEDLLGGIDEDTCSYTEGYKPRQPLYSCRTCAEASGQLAGVCYACSIHCHDGHDLVELYTKRKFCCDCGNSKFKNLKCNLYEEKIATNALNSYNDANFRGLYCTCKKPYPAAEDDETYGEPMHQCVICEDWFHLGHILPVAKREEEEEQEQEGTSTTTDEYSEMICKGCVAKLPFVVAYLKKNSSSEPQGGETCKLTASRSEIEKCLAAPMSVSLDAEWRKRLCRCQSCLKLYADGECEHLLDVEDTMKHYDEARNEEMAKKANVSLKEEVYKRVMKETNGSHDAALYAYMATKQMEDHLKGFIASHMRSGTTFTSADVRKCFEELEGKRIPPQEFLAQANRGDFQP